jgi:hypothetical protein
MKLTPVGTSVGNARSTGLASSGDSSTMRTRSAVRPRANVTSHAALTFRTQSAPGKPATTYRSPSRVIGVTGVDRGVPDLRPGTVNTTGLSPPKLNPSFDIWMKTLFAGFSHQGGLIFSAMLATVVAAFERDAAVVTAVSATPQSVTTFERDATVTLDAERDCSVTFDEDQPTARPAPSQNCARTAFLSGLPSPVNGRASTTTTRLGDCTEPLRSLTAA